MKAVEEMKEDRLLFWLKTVSELLTDLLPDWLTGKSDIMKQKYHVKYGSKDFSMLIRQNKIRTMSIYLFITAIFALCVFGSLMEQFAERKEIGSISRPAYGQAEKLVPLEVQMSYQGIKLKKELTLAVQQKELDKKEKLKLLRDCRDKLKTLILNENKDFNHINKPLNLIGHDPDTGITIQWTSTHPEVVGENGNIDLIRAKDRQPVVLKAELALDDTVLLADYRLKIDRKAEEEDYERSMNARLLQSIEELSRAGDTEQLALPGKLDGGIKLRWFTVQENDLGLLVILFLAALLTTYFKRYDRINKEIRKAEDAILRDLPELINKLVLLLNAGLVVSTAFSKITADYETFYREGKNAGEEKFLYAELAEIQSRVKKSNVSLIRELKEFSERCGVREMVRLTAVISDNWDKGSELAEKLESEAGMMWLERKKRAEEKGKLAETKLTFPLMILLLVLIMVVIAPAMMEV